MMAADFKPSHIQTSHLSICHPNTTVFEIIVYNPRKARNHPKRHGVLTTFTDDPPDMKLPILSTYCVSDTTAFTGMRVPCSTQNNYVFEHVK
jgi:hypothetical protein